MVLIWTDSDYIFSVLDWEKCDSVRSGAAGGGPGAFGREFYADELQAAVFLVYYRDGEDV